MTARVAIELANTLDEIPRLAEAVEAFAEDCALPAKLAFELNLALEELVTNIVSHGYAEAGPHRIEVRMALEADRVRVDVRDDGRPFDPFAQAPAPDLDAGLDERAVGGLGVHLIRTFMDEVRYRRDGELNHVTLRSRAVR